MDGSVWAELVGLVAVLSVEQPGLEMEEVGEVQRGHGEVEAI